MILLELSNLSLSLYLDVHSVALLAHAQRGHAQRLWYQVDIERVLSNLSHCQAYAIHGNETLWQNIFHKFGRHLHRHSAASGGCCLQLSGYQMLSCDGQKQGNMWRIEDIAWLLCYLEGHDSIVRGLLYFCHCRCGSNMA